MGGERSDRPLVLLVGDRSRGASHLGAVLQMGIGAVMQCPGASAEAVRAASGAALAFVDAGILAGDGVEEVARLRAARRDLPVILVADGDEGTTPRAVDAGASLVLPGWPPPADLRAVVASFLPGPER